MFAKFSWFVLGWGKMMVKRQGRLITNGVILEKHEMMTINFLLAMGKDIELIRPITQRGAKTPDFWMDGLKWEAKSPTGSGKYTIQDALRRAAKQSTSIVLDLRRININQQRCIQEVKKQFALSKKIRRIKIIIKRQQTIDLVK